MTLHKSASKDLLKVLKSTPPLPPDDPPLPTPPPPPAPTVTFAPFALSAWSSELPRSQRSHRPLAAVMIIYRDLISRDELFSDVYKIWEITGGLCLEVEGTMVHRTQGHIDDVLIGGNASAEGPRATGPSTSFTKETYKRYIKDYMKSHKGKLEERKPERVKSFMTGAAEQIKHILANFKYQFFQGENMIPNGMVALLDYREGGGTPYMIFFKDGLEMEKC
ncbi:translationally-controlled tumor protein-like [Tenrec ecaudatus]|uniref:translationally-controlled tumor protein-like n=1 Tax=Tenrec ecaudatus TaxID=94439 RepID=UPI003F59437A